MAYIFTIIFISKLVSVEMACLLGIQNEIQAVCKVILQRFPKHHHKVTIPIIVFGQHMLHISHIRMALVGFWFGNQRYLWFFPKIPRKISYLHVFPHYRNSCNYEKYVAYCFNSLPISSCSI